MRILSLNASTPTIKQGEFNSSTAQILVPLDMRAYNLFLVFELPSGEKVFTPSILLDANNMITYALPAAVLSEIGRVQVELQGFVETSYIKSVTYSFTVVKSLTGPTNGTGSELKEVDYLPWFTEAVQIKEEVELIADEYRLDEMKRGQAETLRISKEVTRVAGESARVIAENNRVEGEVIRTANEAIRVPSESGRTSAEGLRVTAESGRAAAEGSRVTAESGRAAAESGRTTAESARVTAESGRAAALSLKADKTFSNSLIDEASSILLGIDPVTLEWVRGDIQSGNINPAATISACTNNYIDLDKDVEIVIKPNQGVKAIVAYYTLTGIFIGTYSPWFTSNYKISKAENRKIRLQLRHTDDRLNIVITDLIKYVSIIRRNISVDLLNERIKLIEGANEPPEYWKTHLSERISLINIIQRDIGYNGTAFAFITDIHWNANSKNSPKLLKKVIEECNIPYYFDGGDIASNPLGVAKQTQIDELIAAKKAFGMDEKVLRAYGNHDDNSINNLYSMTITDKGLYDILYRGNSDTPKIKSGKTGAYYYIDDEKHKLRYIVLNVIDIPYTQTANDTLLYKGMDKWAFRQEQIDWFSDVALNVPNSDYSVIVCSHIPINQGLILNDSIAMNILQAFKGKTTYTGTSNLDADFSVSKTVDFTGKGGDVICWIAGHQHRDAFITLPGNITYKEIVILNDSLDIVSGQPIKTIGTNSENAFDVFIINKPTRNVVVKRIGAGSDRSFDY